MISKKKKVYLENIHNLLRKLTLIILFFKDYLHSYIYKKMSSQEHIALLAENNLTDSEVKKRAGLVNRKPYIAKKLANINDMEDRGRN